jgi:hypothetical protein
MRLRGRGILLLPASSRIIAKSSIGGASALRSKPYRSHKLDVAEQLITGNSNLESEMIHSR